jgi:hypothetical protein
VSRPKIVTVCGSMRFYPQMLQVAESETLAGVIVLMPFSVVAPDDQAGPVKARLDQLHRDKIDLSDEIIVVTNQHGYVGASTRAEMAYAGQTGKAWDVREFKLPEPTPNRYAAR